MGMSKIVQADPRQVQARDDPAEALGEPVGVDGLGVGRGLDPWTTAEVLGVKRTTVHLWKFRGVLPPRDYTINGIDAWDWSTIYQWAAQTGRLSPDVRNRLNRIRWVHVAATTQGSRS